MFIMLASEAANGVMRLGPGLSVGEDTHGAGKASHLLRHRLVPTAGVVSSSILSSGLDCVLHGGRLNRTRRELVTSHRGHAEEHHARSGGCHVVGRSGSAQRASKRA